MAEGSIFQIKEVEGGIIVSEFFRGEEKTITIDEYLADGNDMKELFKGFFEKHPEKTVNLLFGDTDDPKIGSITYQNATVDFFEKKDLKTLISGEDKFLGVVSYQDIFYNTREAAPQKSEEKPGEALSETITGITEDLKKEGARGFINKHKAVSLIVIGLLLIISLLIGLKLSSGAPEKIKVDDKDRTEYFKEKNDFLKNFEKIYSKNPEDALIRITNLVNNLNSIDIKDIPENYKAKFENLLTRAKKLAEKHNVEIEEK